MRLPILVALLLVAQASAQGEAEPPTAENNVLYVHSSGDTTEGWFNTLIQDGEGTTLSPCGSAVGAGTACTQTEFTITMTLLPELTQPLGLDLDGKAEMELFLGGGFASAGQFTVSTQIKQGDVTLFDGPGKTHRYTPRAPGGNVPDPELDKYDLLTFSLSPLVERIEVGTPVVWTVHAEGDGSNPFLGANEGRGRSNVVLPLVDLAPESTGPVPENMTIDGELVLENNGTDRIILASWNVTQSNLTLAANLDANGTARILVDDGQNHTVSFELTTGNQTHDLAALQPGIWSVQISTNHTGILTLELHASDAGGDGNETTDPDDPTDPDGSGDPGGNGTAEPKDSPSWSLGLLLAALVVLARRR